MQGVYTLAESEPVAQKWEAPVESRMIKAIATVQYFKQKLTQNIHNAQKRRQKCEAGNRSSVIDLRRHELNLLPAAVNGLKTSRHLPSPPLHLLWTPHYSLAVQLPAHQLQGAHENQFQNIRCLLRFRKLLGPGVPQQLGGKISPRKAAKTSIGCTAGFELQINSEKEKKIIGMCICHAQFGYTYAKNKISHIWNSNWAERPIFLFAKVEKHPFSVHSRKAIG